MTARICDGCNDPLGALARERTTVNLRIDHFHHIDSGSADLKLDHLLALYTSLLETLTMQATELTQLNDLTNTLAAEVQKEIAEDATYRGEQLAKITKLESDLSAAGALNTDLQSQIDDLKAGVTDVTSRLQPVVDALKATGAQPSNPTPDPALPVEPQPAPPPEPPVESAPA